jgi:hypothetical protein
MRLFFTLSTFAFLFHDQRCVLHDSNCGILTISRCDSSSKFPLSNSTAIILNYVHNVVMPFLVKFPFTPKLKSNKIQIRSQINFQTFPKSIIKYANKKSNSIVLMTQLLLSICFHPLRNFHCNLNRARNYDNYSNQFSIQSQDL